MYKKYTTPLPSMGCEVIERHLEMAQPTKKLLCLGMTNTEAMQHTYGNIPYLFDFQAATFVHLLLLKNAMV